MRPDEYEPSPLLRGACLAAAVVVVFQLFYLGAQPAAAGLFQEPWDKVAHFCVFAGLTALLWKGSAGRMPVAVIAVVILVAGLDELHQAGIPGRYASIGDFVVDAGAALSTGAVMLFLDARGVMPRPQPAGR